MISYPGKKSWDRLHDVGGTAFDVFAQTLCMRREPFNVSRASDFISSTIFERLAAGGGEFSRPIDATGGPWHGYDCQNFERGAKEFMAFEDQLECL